MSSNSTYTLQLTPALKLAHALVFVLTPKAIVQGHVFIFYGEAATLRPSRVS